MSDMNLRRRISHLQFQIQDERQQEIVRAVAFKNQGDPQKAAYHTGLADGCNSLLVELGNLTREYPPDRVPTGVDA